MPEQWKRPTNFIRSGKWQRVLILVLAVISVLTLAAARVKAESAGANCANVACVTTGAHPATIDAKQTTLLNALLRNLAGAHLNLSVADANTLAQGAVGLADLLAALQTKLNLASPTEALAADVTLAQVMQALAQASSNPAVTTALTALGRDTASAHGDRASGRSVTHERSNGRPQQPSIKYAGFADRLH